jgi:hypothetical protein
VRALRGAVASQPALAKAERRRRAMRLLATLVLEAQRVEAAQRVAALSRGRPALITEPYSAQIRVSGTLRQMRTPGNETSIRAARASGSGVCRQFFTSQRHLAHA